MSVPDSDMLVRIAEALDTSVNVLLGETVSSDNNTEPVVDVKRKPKLRVWEIVLLVLGSPIWLSLLIAALVVLLSVYVVVWAVILSLWAVGFTAAGCSVAGVASAAVLVIQGDIPQGAAMLGAGLVCAGISILLFFGCRYATKGVLRLTKTAFLKCRSCFTGKGRVK